MYKCSLCNKTFEYKAYLERHKNNKKPCNKPKQLYNCDLCKSNFEHKSHLEIHNKTKKHITNYTNYIDNSITNNITNINNITNNINVTLVNGFSETNLNALTQKFVEYELLTDNKLVRMLHDFEHEEDAIFGYSEYIIYSFRYFMRLFSKLHFNLAHSENHNCDIYSFVKTKDNFVEYHLLEIDNINKKYKTKCIKYEAFIIEFINLMKKINNKFENPKIQVLLDYVNRYKNMIKEENIQMKIEEELLKEYNKFSELKIEEEDENTRFQKSLLAARRNAFKHLTNSEYTVEE
jgi:uncharacterized protein YlaI